MSKKKFTDGLDSIFGGSVEETLPEGSPLLVKTEKKVEPKRKERSKKRSSKNFTSDLDSLFEDVLTETLEDKAKKIIKDKAKVSPKRRERTDALFGLDALIRRTVETSLEGHENLKKRVTFIFEKSKLKKLKKIAKEEKAYLKDIIGQVMAEYIEEYEAKYGQIQ